MEPAPTPAPSVPLSEPVPIVDPAGLLGSTTAFSAAHQEIVDLFLEEAPRRLRALATADDRGDRDQIARLAHSLAGSADSLGAPRLAAASARLELLARAPRADQDDAHLTSAASSLSSAASPPTSPLTEAIDVVRRELRQLRAVLAGRAADGGPAG
jgi:HPt (histidine-containing phosphotransfer) domain-containing protein